MTSHTTIHRGLMRGVAAAVLALASTLVLAVPAMAGVTGPAFYVDGELYRTVLTPTDLSGTDAPDDSFDIIYDIVGARNVAESAPGDTDYNGGRWKVHALQIDDLEATIAAVDLNDSGTLDAVEEVHAAISAGLASDQGVVASFECPVVPLARA